MTVDNPFPINSTPQIPPYFSRSEEDEYIFISSLSLGGAEKIVTEQLWANHWSKNPIRYTLIVLHNKEKEYSLPPSVNLIRLNSDITSGQQIFQLISHQKKTIVTHLINDLCLNFLFSFKIKINLVLHNDQQGWPNHISTFSHKCIKCIIVVCEYIAKQVRQYTNKTIIVARHQIKYDNSLFDLEQRNFYRKEFNIKEDDKLIGMVGKISLQKNYSKAIETLYILVQKDPSWKLMILGGFEPKEREQYIYLCQLINYYNLSKHVILTGFRDDSVKIMNAFDLALNTSYYEGLSLAVQEFLGNGLEVFCSEVCGQNEILDLKKQIKFYSPNFLPEEIAQTIQNTASLIRHEHNKEFLKNIAMKAIASQRLWNLLHHCGSSKSKENKIVFLTANLNLGGAQRSLTNLALRMNQDGLKAPIIVSNQSNQNYFYDNLTTNGCEIFLATNSVDVFDIANSVLNFCQLNNIKQIVFWNVDPKLQLLIAKISAGWLKIIDVSPGHYCVEVMESKNDFMDGIYFNIKQYYERIDDMVFKYHIAESETPYFEQVKNKLHYIPNGLPDSNFFSYSKQDAAIIDYMNHQNKDIKKFVICGRIAPSKHLDIIFEAFSDFKKTNPLSHLYVVGSAETRYKDYLDLLNNKFSHLYNNCITFLGQCDDASQILSLFDHLIVIGRHQGCPNTLLEATLSDIHVIANDSGGTREIIDEQSGILLPEMTTSNDLLEALYQCNDKNICDFQTYNLKMKAKGFSLDKMFKSYMQLLGEVDKKH